MSKKRAKSGAGSAGVSRWESGLLSTNLEEEGWKACISFVIGNELDDKEYANILSSAVDSRLRRLFSVIYKDTLIEEVNELGNSKTKKGKDAPQFFEICETVKGEYLDKGEEIPLGLLAKLLKWKLLAIKEKDLKRREDEKKALENKDVGKASKGGKEAGGGKRARSKSPAKGKGKKSPEVPSPKKDSKLKKRGEEDDDNKYIDDEPDDGPQHYVIIEGFDQAPLLSLLTDLGININCIIRLQAEDYSLFEKRRNEEEEEMDEDDRPPEVIEEEKKTKEAAKERLEKFWLQHEPLLKKASKGSKLQDVARLTYTVKNHIVPDDMKDNEKRTQFGTDMFEDVACMMYDLLDSERQYRTFLDNMKLIQVPVVEKDPQGSDGQSIVAAGATAAQQQATGQAVLPDAGTAAPEIKPIVVSADVDTRYYNELMDSIPQESISVPLLMHCMLEQVVATSEERGPPSDKDKIPREDGLDQGLAAHIDKMAAKLHIDTGSSKNEQPKQPPNGGNHAKLLAPTTPEFFQFGDDISLRLKHLQSINGFNAMEAELAMLDYIPVAKLREFPRPASSIIKQRAARLQELLHHLSSGVVDPAEVDRAFKQFVFESLVLRGTEEDGCVSQQVVSEGIVWDDPYPLFTKREKDESETMEKEEGGVQKLTAENVQKNENELESKETDQTQVTNTGILKPEGRKSRQGSASSLRSARSTVHFEKDASGLPIIPPKDPAPPLDTPRETLGDALNEMEGGKDTLRPGSSRSKISIHDVIGDTQLRNLDDWCYAEHFEPHVLIQILEDAREMYPFMDTYYHKRDHTLLVVMHNPVGPDLTNTQPWDTKLHSDVGFRNYMEHVADNISSWVDIEETKYQAEMREKELARQRELALSRASTPAPASRPASSKSRKGTPKKSRSKSPKGRRSVSPAQTVDNLDPNSGQFMRPGSMKAWKVEQDKIREEEEKKRLEKEKKAGRKSARSRSRSASPVKKSDGDEKKDKKPGSASKDGSGRGSRKGDKDKAGGVPAEPQEEAAPETPREPERVYPFVGYDMGNNIIQANGNTTTLFPSDGGQIRTELTQFINGPKFVKTSVLKDGHVFVVHLLDPRDKEEVEGGGAEEKVSKDGGDESNKESVTEKADEETQEKDQKVEEGGKKKKKDLPLSSFGSFTANLSDGMVLSFSNHGIEGKTKKAAEKKEIEVFIPPAPTPTPPPLAPSPRGKRGGSGKKGKQQQQQQQQQAEAEKQAQLLADQKQKEEEERHKKELEAEAEAAEPEVPPFQQLFVSCPDGLHVSYMLEPTEDEETCDPNVPGRLLIRQCYSTKNNSQQPCEASRENPALQEISRLVTSEGSVIKMMRDGSTQVLFADGAVSCSPAGPSSTANPSSPTPRDQSPQRGGSSLSQRSESPSKKSAKGKVSDALDQDQPLPETSSSQEWVTTTPTGQRIGTRPDGTPFDPKECLLYSATDPVSGEVLTTREDRVITVDRPNKMRIVDHNEGTRITTYYKKVIFRQQCDEAKETGETPVSGIRDVKHVKVECVGYATVIFNCEDSVATTIFGNGSEIVAIPDGSFEILHCEGSRLAVGVDGAARYTPKEAESGEPSMIGSYTMQHNNVVAVETCDLDGNHFAVKWNSDIYASLVPREEGSKVVLGGEGEEEAEKVSCKMTPIPRFFVIHPDGSGTEMLRQRDIAPYVHQAGMDPNVAVLNDPIPDHPEIHGVTIMQPHTSTISQKWLNQYDEPNIIPRNLRSREFDKLPAKENKTPGPKFGTKVGKGMAVSTVPRPPQRGPVPKCPKRLQLRQFVAYRPMEPELRGKMKEGLEAYAKEMKKKVMEARRRAIKDPRSQQERVRSGDLLAHILAQLEDETTKENKGSQHACTDAPRTTRRLTSTEPIKPLNVQTEGNAVTLYETSTAPPPLPPAPRPKPKYTDSDWERVRREHEEEKACRDALLNRSVPPYFESDWGKAFKRAEEAVANGEPAPDMEALTKDLPLGNRPGAVSTAMSLPSTPADSPGAPSAQPGAISSAQPSETSDSISPMKAATTGSNQARDGLQSSTPSAQQGLVPASPSDTRPLNPTPGHATGQGTPTALRPTNPTPAHASQPQGTGRPVNPTPQSASENHQGGAQPHPTLPSETPSSFASFPAHPSTIPEMVEEGPLTNRSAMTGSISPGMPKPDVQSRINDVPMESRPNMIPSAGSDIVLTRSLLVDVNGEPRQDAIRLPAAILGQKPGALPNNRFDELEDSVRRKVFTSSIAGAQLKGTADLSRMRGFELVPGEVNFGTLREGCTYAFQVNLKNVGVDSCRYKIRQPPPGTGLQVVYSPGPVAAGMKAKLELVLYAIAVGVEGDSGHGAIDHHLEITTETELLYLPISADILTAAEYDGRTHAGLQPKTSAGVRLIATRPPSREGIIRPRRDIPQQSQENLDN